MGTKERPHRSRRIDAAAIPYDEPLRKRAAAGPNMSTALNCVEHDGRVVSTIRVFAARDIRRDDRLDRLRRAAVSSRPIRGPEWDRRKGIRRDPRLTAIVKSEAVRGSVKRNHRDGSMFGTPAPRQSLRSSYH